MISVNLFKQESFSSRYVTKIASSILIAFFNLFIQLVLPRLFSVEEYGFYSYNLNIFTSVVTIFNLSASDCLISKFSKNTDDIGYLFFYFLFYACVSIILCLGMFCVLQFDNLYSSFAGQTFIVILLGLEACIVRKLLTDFVAVFDVLALSKIPALIQIIQKLLMSFCILFAYFLCMLKLEVFYLMEILTIGICSILLLWFLKKYYSKLAGKPFRRKIRVYVSEFFVFCKPLAISIIVAQGILILKNYALLKWAGVAEVAAFGAAWLLNGLLTYVFSPYAELMKREFAIIHFDEEILKMKITQSLKTMMFLMCYFCIFIAVNSKDVLFILFGNKYSDSILITQMIMFYTIYQAWGQICGSYMIAVERTNSYSIISIITNMFSLLLVFVFQIPNFIFPHSLGLNGLGISYLLSNIVSVLFVFLYISKTLKLKCIKIFIYHFTLIISSVFIAKVTNLIFSMISLSGQFISTLIRILGSGVIYSLVFILIVIKKPEIAGIEKAAVDNILKKLKGK